MPSLKEEVLLGLRFELIFFDGATGLASRLFTDDFRPGGLLYDSQSQR